MRKPMAIGIHAKETIVFISLKQPIPEMWLAINEGMIYRARHSAQSYEPFHVQHTIARRKTFELLLASLTPIPAYGIETPALPLPEP